MCGIVGGVSQKNISSILIDGLKRLEYRGYDSAGLAMIDAKKNLQRVRAVGKVKKLEDLYQENFFEGYVGIAHTRWATHGAPSTENAHPHVSSETVAVVHNGIIENHEVLRKELIKDGYSFTSQTDTEVIVHLIEKYLRKELLEEAVAKAVERLDGAYALGVISSKQPDTLIACRKGSPLVIGVTDNDHFLASDVHALLSITKRFVFLEEDDLAVIKQGSYKIFDKNRKPVNREEKTSQLDGFSIDKGEHAHYMLKEIHEQPEAVAQTLEGRLSGNTVLPEIFGVKSVELFPKVKAVQIVACGTSFHAAIVARYWIEHLAKIPCNVEIASEYRYRDVVVRPDTLFVTVSQSGETADTLAALEYAKTLGHIATLCICNVPESSLMRASDMSLLTRAGPEIGVASTKAFTTQLTAFLLLALTLGRYHAKLDQTPYVEALRNLPTKLQEALKLDIAIKELSEDFVNKNHALFLGRGAMYPIALEGALKLKEISYIHAEGYPAGELKHGPLALVDANMPVVAVAPNYKLLEKLKSNLSEVRARGGCLYVFADPDVDIKEEKDIRVLTLPNCSEEMAPIVYTLPLQLLAYHVAVLRGTDVDQPRNLAKSVTVE